jgi:hypothetical protein
MADRCARRDSAAAPAELTAALRDNAEHPWKPPGGGLVGALTHDVIHGLDITVALDIDRKVPADRLAIVLDSITAAGSLKFFGTSLTGIQLRADDTGWSLGSGTPVTGAAQDLALVVCGRRLPPGRLSGPFPRPASWARAGPLPCFGRAPARALALAGRPAGFEFQAAARKRPLTPLTCPHSIPNQNPVTAYSQGRRCP